MSDSSRTTHIMRDLKAYVDKTPQSLEEQKRYKLILKILDRLADDELKYIHAKFVQLAAYRPGVNGRQVFITPKAIEVRELLDLNDKQFKELIDRTHKKVLELYNQPTHENTQDK